MGARRDLLRAASSLSSSHFPSLLPPDGRVIPATATFGARKRLYASLHARRSHLGSITNPSNSFGLSLAARSAARARRLLRREIRIGGAPWCAARVLSRSGIWPAIFHGQGALPQ